MLPRAAGPWPPRILSFGVWALAAASLAYWALRLSTPAGVAVPPSAAAAAAPPDSAAVARLLGARTAAQPVAAAPAAAGSRFALAGVVAGPGRRGAALISVDGKPAKPFRVGGAVDAGLMLQSVEPRRAVLAAAADAAPALTLELPPPKR